MKKHIVTIAAAALLCSSCGGNQEPQQPQQNAVSIEIPYVYTKKVVIKDAKPLEISRITHFDYNGHSYIDFYVRTPYGSSGIVHDPDCACFGGNGEEQCHK